MGTSRLALAGNAENRWHVVKFNASLFFISSAANVNSGTKLKYGHG